jgi:hypothetical protein
MSSPYYGIDTDEWKEVTQKLIDSHPLTEHEIVDVVLTSWNSIFASRFGTAGFTIGKQIFPKPQIMGFLLHELIPLELEARHSGAWKVDEEKNDKDCVCILDDYFSFEIKTSSNANKIFGNRSYAQASSNGRKAKDGFYLTVNFEKFNDSGIQPEIKLIRFGWLDSTDWRGQKAATGQQSNLPPEVYDGKLKIIYKS